jgi:hypothetical protein
MHFVDIVERLSPDESASQPYLHSYRPARQAQFSLQRLTSYVTSALVGA